MARRTTATVSDEKTFDLASVEFEEVDTLPGQLSTGRAAKDNPMLPKVQALPWDSPRAFTVPNGEAARVATNDLRGAASSLSVGLKLRYSVGEQSVNFDDAKVSTDPVRISLVKTHLREKQERRYTATDIRDWIRDQIDAGELDHDSWIGELSGRLSREARDTYREAHGIA